MTARRSATLGTLHYLTLLVAVVATAASCGEDTAVFGGGQTATGGTGGTGATAGTGGTGATAGTGGTGATAGTGGTGATAGSGGVGGSPCDGVDCSHLDTECEVGWCVFPDEHCEAEPLSPGTTCGDSTETDCDAADTCDDGGVCEENHVADGTPCDDCPAGPGNCGDCEGGICPDRGDCDPVGVVSTCGGVVADSNDGAGSTNWNNVYTGCMNNDGETGPEIAYTFVPTRSDGAVALLTALSADLDLFVLEDTGDGCSVDDCVAMGFAQGGEQVFFPTVAGTTYYIVVEGWQGAVSPFELFVHEVGDIVLSEVYGGDPDYVEVQNRAGCPVDLDPYVVRHYGNCENAAHEFDFPPDSTVTTDGVFRFVDDDTMVIMSNERPMGMDLCDEEGAVRGYTALCFGDCDVQQCENLLDFVQRSHPLSMQPPGGPACAAFDSPINTGGMAVGQSTHRTGFAGAPLSWLNADWAIAAYTRD